VLVIGLRRGSEALALPPLDMALAQGDEVVLLASLEALARMRTATGRAGAAGDQPTSDKHVEIQLTIL